MTDTAQKRTWIKALLISLPVLPLHNAKILKIAYKYYCDNCVLLFILENFSVSLQCIKRRHDYAYLFFNTSMPGTI